MHQIFQPFLFTGRDLAGGELYVALWGGAGSTSYRGRKTSTRQYQQYQNIWGGSGGLVLAKITGIADADELAVYVGGRGSTANNNSSFLSTIPAAPGSRAMSRTHNYTHGGAGGGASALTINVGGNTGHEFLLIAPSGGGGGGARYVYSSSTSRHGGHGGWSGDLGRSNIAAGGSVTGAPNTFAMLQGGFGKAAGDLPAFAQKLIGGKGDNRRSNSKNGRGGGGAPNGGAGATAGTISKGGGGGIGYIAGGPASGAAQTLYTTNFTANGANITIQAYAFTGREVKKWVGSAPGYQSQFADLLARYNGSGASAAFVREVVDALGWVASPASGNLNWPPVMQDKDQIAGRAPAPLDLANAAEIQLKDYPGRAGSVAKTTATSF